MAADKFVWLKSREFLDLTLAVLVLTFAFSFRFEKGGWLENFILVLGLTVFSVFAHEFAHRWAAKKLLCQVESKTFWFGIIACLVLVFLTNGFFIFAAPWAVTIKYIRMFSPGKSSPKWHPGPWDFAKIALSGALANFALAVIGKILIPYFGYSAEKLVLINIWLAAFNLFPFMTLIPIIAWRSTPIGENIKETPYLEGEFVFFGSRLLWVFAFSFVVVGGLGLWYLPGILGVLLAAILASIFWLAWFFYFNMGGEVSPQKP